MHTIKSKPLYLCLFLIIGLSSCFEDDLIQPISLTSLSLHAGGIFNGEYRSEVSTPSPGSSTQLSRLGLEVRVSEWMEIGEVENATDFVSENTIVDLSITSDSMVMVSEDSIFTAGEDLTPLFMVSKESSRSFEATLPVSNLYGRNISRKGILLKYTRSLLRDLDQTFSMEVTMDDGQTFSMRSNRVRVEAD